MKYLIVLFFFSSLLVYSQDPGRFREEVGSIQKKYDSIWDPAKKTVVFTGSSSIRIWEDLGSIFPKYQTVNSGFGGSHASDLLAFSQELILQFNPEKVFIYEGDNDISANKRPKEILATTKEIIKKIRIKNRDTQIVLIAAKPSIARWNLKRTYKRLNRKFKKLGKKDPLIQFADVWKPMLQGNKVRKDIFLEDGLHMNKKGYDIWFSVIKPFMN